MCDYFLQRMEGDQAGGGDLTDIVRAGGAMPGNSSAGGGGGDDLPSTAADDEWHHHLQQPLLFPPPSPSQDAADVVFGAGDPFAGLGGDPFSSDYSSSCGADFVLDVGAMPDAMAPKVGAFDAAGISGGQMLDMGCGGRKPLLPRGMGMQQQMPGGMGMEAPRQLMPSPAGLSPIAIRPYPAMTAGDMVKLGITAGQAAGCAIDAAVAGMQMSSSSPRTAGIKRRKNQARKVVCIPAPTTAGSRPTGEVVPSDLWAWRKYGQKPIKGSPHPRGYYRCSSSKGCSARKQVERSRTDSNMLVVTYTSEHNHPWPTQRNALAGSTRSHHGKNGGSGSSGAKSSQNEKQSQANNVKEERKDHATAATTTTTSTITTTTSTASPMIVKLEETLLAGSSESLLERDHQSAMDTAAGVLVDHSDLMDHVFSESYRPMIPESGHHEDFFADLAELESDPMSLIFSKEYMEARPSGTTGGDHGQEKAVAATKDLDPFDMLDWSTASTTAGSTFEQGKGG